MRIATLQFAPTLGEVAVNREKVCQLLDRAEERGELKELDLLVLPEMALSGKCTLSSLFQHISHPCPLGFDMWVLRTSRLWQATISRLKKQFALFLK